MMKKPVNFVTFRMEESSSELLPFVFLTSATICEVKQSAAAQSALARHSPEITLLPERSLSPGNF